VTRDLTVGKPGRVLSTFALPMLISVLFQQFYNMADNIIAGQFISNAALDAVSISYPITNIYLAVALGINIGISVVISQLFGAQQMEKMKTAVSTCIIASFSISALFTILGIAFAQPILAALNTPTAIMAPTLSYLRIYTLSMVFIFLYNTATGIFSALGDTITPLIFLIFSSLANVGLNILFVTAFAMDVSGLAWATFLCQGIAAAASCMLLFVRLKKIPTGPFARFSPHILSTTATVAIPGIMQKSFVSFGNVLIQSVVNGFAAAVPGIIGGFSSATKLLYIFVNLQGAVDSAVASYAAQNIGARKLDRVKDGVKAGYLLCLTFCIPATLFFVFFPEIAMGIFVPAESTDVIAAGSSYLRTVSPFLALVAVKQVCAGVLHGAGAAKMFATTTFIDLFVRVILAYIFSHWMGPLGLWISWPFGWGVGAAVSVYFYRRGKWKDVHLLDNL